MVRSPHRRSSRAVVGGVAPFLLASSLLLDACGPDAADYDYLRTERCAEGCDAGSPPEPDAGPIDAGPPDVPDDPIEDWDVTDAGPLSGIFAVEVTVEAKVVIDVQARQLYRMRLLQRNADVQVRTTPCRVDLPSVEGVAELSIPPPLEALLRTKHVEEEGPFLSAAEPLGATFAPPAALLLLGTELADPAGDPLPTMEAPGTAVDEDADGNPGVTVAAETVLCRQPEIAFIALRTSAALMAVVDDLDSFAGDVDPALEFSVLGYSDPCLAAAAALEVEVRPGSRFRAVRVGDAQDLDGNGNVSCPEIDWYAPRLFPEEPAP